MHDFVGAYIWYYTVVLRRCTHMHVLRDASQRMLILARNTP
jgi:hypothetical protein